jgi:hypothetical protein
MPRVATRVQVHCIVNCRSSAVPSNKPPNAPGDEQRRSFPASYWSRSPHLRQPNGPGRRVADWGRICVRTDCSATNIRTAVTRGAHQGEGYRSELSISLPAIAIVEEWRCDFLTSTGLTRLYPPCPGRGPAPQARLRASPPGYGDAPQIRDPGCLKWAVNSR